MSLPSSGLEALGEVDYSIMEQASRSRGPAAECAVLGYLIEAPMHGYELRDRLAKGLGALWRIASSQLYQVLHRMEEAGWVASVVETRSAGPSRTVYRATEAGAAAFWEWSTSPVRQVRRIRIEFLAKVYFLRRLAPDRLTGLVEGQLEDLRDLRGRLCARKGVATDDGFLGALAVSYRRSQVEATIRWLEENKRALGA